MEHEVTIWKEQIIEAMKEIGFIYCLDIKSLGPALTNIWCSNMAVQGYSDEFIKKTLDRMFEKCSQLKKKLNDKDK